MSTWLGLINAMKKSKSISIPLTYVTTATWHLMGGCVSVTIGAAEESRFSPPEAEGIDVGSLRTYVGTAGDTMGGKKTVTLSRYSALGTTSFSLSSAMGYLFLLLRVLSRWKKKGSGREEGRRGSVE